MTPTNPKTLAAMQAASLAVLLQAAIDEGQFKQAAKMRAKALYKTLYPLMMEMYKHDDAMTVAFHTLSNVLEQVVKYLCAGTLEEFEARMAQVAKAVDYPFELVFEGEGVEDAK